MKVNIYTIYDVLAEECGPVFQAKNDSVACRAVDAMLKEVSGTAISDYHLYCLGSFETESRIFTPDIFGGRMVSYTFNGSSSEVVE